MQVKSVREANSGLEKLNSLQYLHLDKKKVQINVIQIIVKLMMRNVTYL